MYVNLFQCPEEVPNKCTKRRLKNKQSSFIIMTATQTLSSKIFNCSTKFLLYEYEYVTFLLVVQNEYDQIWDLFIKHYYNDTNYYVYGDKLNANMQQCRRHSQHFTHVKISNSRFLPFIFVIILIFFRDVLYKVENLKFI